MCNWSLSLGNVQIRTSLCILLLLGILPKVYAQSDVYTFENPFYEDCKVLDAATHAYIKQNDIKSVTKTTAGQDQIYSIESYYYNERAVLDSIVQWYGLNQKKVSHFQYDTFFNLQFKTDSFFSSPYLDSVHCKSWTYNSQGRIISIYRLRSTYGEGDNFIFNFYPSIVYDTVIGDMVRYKYKSVLGGLDSNYRETPNDSIGGLEWRPGIYAYDFFYWVQDGMLVLKGVDRQFESVKLKNNGDRNELSYCVFRNDTSVCLGVQTFDMNWQPLTNSVFYKGSWVVIDDKTYLVDGNLALSAHYEIGTNTHTTTTYIRDQEARQLTKAVVKEVYPFILNPNVKVPKPIEKVTKVSYEYSKVIPE